MHGEVWATYWFGLHLHKEERGREVCLEGCFLGDDAPIDVAHLWYLAVNAKIWGPALSEGRGCQRTRVFQALVLM